ncbi:MAG TPA: hypothetical protein VFP72_04400 [Kineosporiaceae bacterium]|nr:hypothetical protein [Kineosporiaceae bacterium]
MGVGAIPWQWVPAPALLPLPPRLRVAVCVGPGLRRGRRRRGRGLPLGVQLIGERYHEHTLLEAGRLVERALGTLTPIDPVPSLIQAPQES